MKVVLCCRQTSSCSLIRGFRIRFSRGDEYITIAATVINFIPTLPSIYHVDCPMGGFHISLPPKWNDVNKLLESQREEVRGPKKKQTVLLHMNAIYLYIQIYVQEVKGLYVKYYIYKTRPDHGVDQTGRSNVSFVSSTPFYRKTKRNKLFNPQKYDCVWQKLTRSTRYAEAHSRPATFLLLIKQ